LNKFIIFCFLLIFLTGCCCSPDFLSKINIQKPTSERDDKIPTTTIETATEKPAITPGIDILIVFDTTANMGDELDNLKNNLTKISENIKKGEPSPDIKIGVVAYKDRGDDYVIKTFELNEDIEAVEKFINSLNASGGGDHEESINEALHEAIQEIDLHGHDGGKVIFLIADAPPHMDYADDYDYREEIKIAGTKGIIINTIECSGLPDYGKIIFKEIASATGGNFEAITYYENPSEQNKPKNNLSDLLTELVQKELMKQGVKY